MAYYRALAHADAVDAAAASTPDRIGVLVVNLGTPDSPSYFAVQRYLREFLGDRLASCPVDVGDHHVCALAGQMPGDAFTDAVAPSGDEGDLAVDVECHAPDRRGTCSAQPRREAGSGWACTTLRC